MNASSRRIKFFHNNFPFVDLFSKISGNGLNLKYPEFVLLRIKFESEFELPIRAYTVKLSVM